MAKDKLTEYSATNASNDVIGDISVSEGMLPSAVNNALREQMTHLKNFADGTDGINVLALDDDDASASIKIQAPSAVTTTTTLTLPDGDGDAGAMLQTNGSGQLAWSTAYRNRNLILNGGMQISQRAASSTSSGYVSLDRWYVNQSGGSTTFSQETNSNPSETDGLQKYARLNVSASSDFTSIRQPIEDVTSVPAGTATISFYAKGTAPTGGLYIWGTQNFGSGGSASVGITELQITASLTASWVRYTAQITIPSIDGKTIGDGNYFLLNIGQYSNTATTAYDLNITGVQLEVGEQATPFEHRSYGDELLACMRYYQQIGGELSNVLCTGQCTSSTLAQFFIPFIVPVRADPTCSVSDQTHFRVFNAAVSGIPDTTNMTIAATNAASHGGFRILTTVGSGLVAGNATMLSGSDSDNNAGIIKMDAEL